MERRVKAGDESKREKREGGVRKKRAAAYTHILKYSLENIVSFENLSHERERTEK